MSRNLNIMVDIQISVCSILYSTNSEQDTKPNNKSCLFRADNGKIGIEVYAGFGFTRKEATLTLHVNQRFFLRV